MHIHVDIYAGNGHKDCFYLDTTNNIRSKWGTDDVECNLRFVDNARSFSLMNSKPQNVSKITAKIIIKFKYLYTFKNTTL